MKLYEIPRGSKMRIEFSDGFHSCTFHKLDGMYSYCTIDDYPEGYKAYPVFHLKATTPMIKVDDHYEIDEVTSPKGEK